MELPKTLSRLILKKDMLLQYFITANATLMSFYLLLQTYSFLALILGYSTMMFIAWYNIKIILSFNGIKGPTAQSDPVNPQQLEDPSLQRLNTYTMYASSLLKEHAFCGWLEKTPSLIGGELRTQLERLLASDNTCTAEMPCYLVHVPHLAKRDTPKATGDVSLDDLIKHMNYQYTQWKIPGAVRPSCQWSCPWTRVDFTPEDLLTCLDSTETKQANENYAAFLEKMWAIYQIHHPQDNTAQQTLAPSMA